MADRNPNPFETIVPKPVETVPTEEAYQLSEDTVVAADGPDAIAVAEHLVECLQPSLAFDLPVRESPDVDDGIALVLDGVPDEVGEEGYELTVTDGGVTVRANAPAGFFMGVQTLRQLLPPAVESGSPEGSWTIPGGRILDHPRFAYRGVHLDVARHFFEVDEVKQYIDHAVRYKCNHLHLHLTDDQGWRVEIEGWPALTEVGASTEVGGSEGGYYTQAEWADIVTYAQERFVTVVPEVDVPGHTNAALASYAELNPDGERAEPYTGIEVGFSTLAVDAEETYEFLDDVFGHLGEQTPGPYLHLGGDEVEKLTDEEYTSFLERVADNIEGHDERPMGWHEALAADLPASTVIQYWAPGGDAEEVVEYWDEEQWNEFDVTGAAAAGNEFVLSPATRAYLDMKYDGDTELGLDWAGHVSITDAYDWDPGEYVEGVDESSVLGVEAAMWTETLETMTDIEFMLFPRLPAIAERGWTPATETGWDDFERRLAQQAPRWEAAGINFYRSPEVDWPDGSD